MSTKAPERWAVLDWGVGGCGIYARLKKEVPGQPLIYWSDAGFTPYGKVPRAALARRLEAVFGELERRGATHVIVACNAASTVLGDVRARRHGLQVTGVIAPTLAALSRGPKRNFGVVGGVRTVRADVYGRALRAAGHQVRQRAAQPLSAFVEAGDLDSASVVRAVDRAVAPLADVDALILACTHYPALAPLFCRALPGVRLVDPAAATWQWIARRWQPTEVRPRVADLVLTTGPVAPMRRAALAAFGVRFERVTRVAVASSR